MQTKSKIAALFNLTTPIAYSLVFLVQIVINYSISNNPFHNLQMWEYITVLCAMQTLVFIATDESPRYVAKAALSGELDYMLIRPLNFFYYKYFRTARLNTPIMLVIYYSGLLICGGVGVASWNEIGALVVYSALAGIIALNMRAAMRGLVFYLRDVLSLTGLEEAINLFTVAKPPEVFPSFIRLFFTFVVPYIVVNNGGFDILRNINPMQAWSLLIIWLAIAIALNSLIWRKGIQKYESSG